MHRVVGRRISEIDAAWVLARATEHERTIVDLGTGDGRAVIIEAADDPQALVIGIDADARTMAELSRRAAAAPAKGGHPNAIFLMSGVELLPPAIDGIGDRVTVRFPWGSLLRGAIGAEPAVSAAIARLVGGGGTLELAVSIVERDRLAARDEAADAATRDAATRDATTADTAATADTAPTDAAFARLGRLFDGSDVERIRATFGDLGLRLVDVEPMTHEAVAAYGSSWARRLRVGRDRPAWRVRLSR